MAMSKQDFIALANAIRGANNAPPGFSQGKFNYDHIVTLADFCQSQNSNFNRDRWLDYIAGKCGPRGGSIKAA